MSLTWLFHFKFSWNFTSSSLVLLTLSSGRFEISNFQLSSNTLTTNWQKMLEFYSSSDITCLWIRSNNCTKLLRSAKLSYIIKVNQNNWLRCVFFANKRESPTPYFRLLEILKLESIFTDAQLSTWGVKCPPFLLFLVSH